MFAVICGVGFFIFAMLLFGKKCQANTKLAPGERFKLDGLYNLRDLGGYPCEGGRVVKSGLLFRSDDLNQISDDDLAIIDKLAITTVVDFRADREYHNCPDRFTKSMTQKVHLPISAASLSTSLDDTSEIYESRMQDIYSDLVNTHIEKYKAFFKLVQDKSALPLLFHCSAGKDRTGYGAMLIYSALGVKHDIIMQDYLISASNAEERYAEIITEHPDVKPYFTVYAHYLDRAMEEINKNYGGVISYLVNQLDVDLNLMRDIYTQ